MLLRVRDPPSKSSRLSNSRLEDSAVNSKTPATRNITAGRIFLPNINYMQRLLFRGLLGLPAFQFGRVKSVPLPDLGESGVMTRNKRGSCQKMACQGGRRRCWIPGACWHVHWQTFHNDNQQRPGQNNQTVPQRVRELPGRLDLSGHLGIIILLIKGPIQARQELPPSPSYRQAGTCQSARGCGPGLAGGQELCEDEEGGSC